MRVIEQRTGETVLDGNPISNLRSFHERYLPITYGGIWMQQYRP